MAQSSGMEHATLAGFLCMDQDVLSLQWAWLETVGTHINIFMNKISSTILQSLAPLQSMGSY